MTKPVLEPKADVLAGAHLVPLFLQLRSVLLTSGTLATKTEERP